MPGAIHFVLLILLLVSKLLDADNTIRLPIYKQQQQHAWKSKRVYSRLGIRSTSNNTTNNKANLYNDAGSEYLVTVGIGTPAQEFLVALDTGR